MPYSTGPEEAGQGNERTSLSFGRIGAPEVTQNRPLVPKIDKNRVETLESSRTSKIAGAITLHHGSWSAFRSGGPSGLYADIAQPCSYGGTRTDLGSPASLSFHDFGNCSNWNCVK